MRAIILAGGKGTRLMPYTTIFPKPMLPIGDVPILDIIIRQLKKYGFREVTLAVGYLAELLMAYFNDGGKYDIIINYSKEEIPLGTAGPLKNINNLQGPFLVMNGDILTNLNYQKLIEFHNQSDAIATIAMHKKTINIDLGVIKLDNESQIMDYREKPTYDFVVSMGIYIFEDRVLDYIDENKKLDFPDLVKILLRSGEKIRGFLSDDIWLDIGRHEDYQKAVQVFSDNRDAFF